jgi:hypothetical protein
MPRERKELIRPSGFREAEKLFVLSFEGTRSEPRYFEGLRNSAYFNDSGRIEFVELTRKQNEKLGSDPKVVKQILKAAKSNYALMPTDEFWMIVDRDDWEAMHHIDFDQIVKECAEEKNFFMAMSNPCFEFWLLLHLEKFDIEAMPNEERELLYRNPKISNKRHHIEQVLCGILGNSYSKRLKASLFLPGVYRAIERAKTMHIDGENYPKGFGSDVYRLVEKVVKPWT